MATVRPCDCYHLFDDVVDKPLNGYPRAMRKCYTLAKEKVRGVCGGLIKREALSNTQ